MTALKEFDRLESTGLWRSAPEAQRRDVVVAFGDATLVIADTQGRALTHWSLAAVIRINSGRLPALYSPDGSETETLEVDDEVMINAIEHVQTTIARNKPHPGRLRFAAFGLSFAAVAALAVFWLPNALIEHTVAVVPAVKRVEIGAALLVRTARLAGQPCNDSFGARALQRLQLKLEDGATTYHVLRAALPSTVTLPGGPVLINRTVIEDFDDPSIVAGYLLAEQQRSTTQDPLLTLLRATGPVTAFRLLTTGDIPNATLDAYAETLLTAEPAAVDDAGLLALFAKHAVPSTPYAYAVDITGEQTLTLIEADPMASQSPPAILDDGNWISLQGICDE